MPTYTVSGKVWRDDDQDGIQQEDEPGLQGRTVRVTNDITGDFIAGGQTNASGNYTISFTIPDDPIQIAVTCILPNNDWVITYGDYQGLIDSAHPTWANTDFGLYTSNLGECFQPASSWIRQVCWNPNTGLEIYYMPHGKRPFACWYPGTVYQDYVNLRRAPSVGHMVRDFYYFRAYVPIAPL